VNSMPPWMTRKIAGVPTWGWMIAAMAAIGIGLYIRKRSVAASSTGASSGGPTSLDDLANSLAGGNSADSPSGMDPALAELLANAQMALASQGQGYSDAMMGGPGGYYDPGTYYDPGAGYYDSPPTYSVPSSPVGTAYRGPTIWRPLGQSGGSIPQPRMAPSVSVWNPRGSGGGSIPQRSAPAGATIWNPLGSGGGRIPTPVIPRGISRAE
jgi:hypothetical protein